MLCLDGKETERGVHSSLGRTEGAGTACLVSKMKTRLKAGNIIF